MTVHVLLARVDGNFGGVERNLISLAKGLDAARFHPILLPIANEGELVRLAEEERIGYEFLPMRHRLDIIGAGKILIETAQRRDAGLIHTFGIRSNTLAAYAKKKLGIPWIVRLPNINIHDYKNSTIGYLSHYFNNFLIRKADALQVISPQLEDYVQKHVCPSQKIYCIPNGVDLSFCKFSGKGKDFRSRYDIGPDELIIGSIGRLDYVKGYDMLFEAFQQVLQIYHHSRLVLVGDGPERKNLKEQSRRLFTPDKVIFTGYVSNILPFLEEFSVFVCSSRSEGVPNAMLEAMAMEIPIISTRVGGIESVLTDGTNGVLVPPNDPKVLALAILDLLTQKEKADMLGRNAHQRIEQDFSSDKMVECVQRMYVDVLS